MAMRVRGTMTVREFIDWAVPKGAELSDLDGHFRIGGLEGIYNPRCLIRNSKSGSLAVIVPGEDDDDMLLDAEFVQFLKIRLKLR